MRYIPRIGYILIVLLASCGGGVEGTGGTIDLAGSERILGDIDPKNNINSLNTTDREKICQNVRNSARSAYLPNLFCPQRALIFTSSFFDEYLNGEQLANTTPGLQVQCENAVSNCISTAPSFEEACLNTAEYNTCFLDNPVLSQCNVEIGLVAKCLVDKIDDNKNESQLASCDRVRLENGQISVDEIPANLINTEIKSCEEVLQRCSIGVGFNSCNGVVSN